MVPLLNEGEELQPLSASGGGRYFSAGARMRRSELAVSGRGGSARATAAKGASGRGREFQRGNDSYRLSSRQLRRRNDRQANQGEEFTRRTVVV